MPDDAWERGNLHGVDERLATVVRRAHATCPVPFCVFEGLRTQARQRQLVASGKSTTMSSRHLTGKAVDLVPLVDGQPRWDWDLIYPIAEAMRDAARAEEASVRWGGFWGDLGSSQGTTRKIVGDYVVTRKASGKVAFLDGPHYELA